MLTSFNPNKDGKKVGKTNQANNNQATKGAPLITSIYNVLANLITGKELALPNPKNKPNGKPAIIATEANIIFNKKPPHRVGLGPFPIKRIKMKIGIINIQPNIKNFLDISRYFFLRKYVENEYAINARK